MIPVKHILESCMSGTEYQEGGEDDEENQEDEDPEEYIPDEGPSGEPEPEPAPAQAEQEVPSLVHDLMSEEHKNIPVNMTPEAPPQAPQAPPQAAATPEDDDVLFGNAPERKT
jgi:hypothetical protein